MIENKTLPNDVYYYYPFTYDIRDRNEIIIRELIDEVKEKIEYNWISCYFLDSESNNLEKLDIEESGFNMIDVVQFENGTGLAAWVAEKKRPILLSSVHRGQRFQSNPVKSFVCCPIVRESKTIGVINLGHIKNQAYNKKILKVLQEILNPIEVFDQV